MAQGPQGHWPYNPSLLLAGQPLHVASAFQDGAKPVSIDDIINIVMDRPPVGVDKSVRDSFRLIHSSEQGVGVIGWQFIQHDITYTYRYKDNDNTDTCFFKAEIPADLLLIYHGDILSIAGKTHALSVIMSLLTDDQRRDTMSHIPRLAAGCLDKTLGEISTGLNRKNLPLYWVNARKCLILPPDNRPTDPVTQAYVLFDWRNDTHRIVVDVSNMLYPQFTKYPLGYGSSYPIAMDYRERQATVRYMYGYLQKASPAVFEECRSILFRLAKSLGLDDLFSSPRP